MFTAESLRLYLVLDPGLLPAHALDETVAGILGAGVTCLQLRWKSATDQEIVELATRLLPICNRANIPLIVNDRVDLALASGAHGVHLGTGDLPLAAARSIAGDEFIIGYSPETDDDIEAAAQIASYLGIGPFFHTTTKGDAGTALGPEEFSRRRLQTELPVVAIGGINHANARAPIEAGANGIAVVSAILMVPDPVAATRLLSHELARIAT